MLGGELAGFAAVLLRSGVETIIASLRPVGDVATRCLSWWKLNRESTGQLSLAIPESDARPRGLHL